MTVLYIVLGLLVLICSPLLFVILQPLMNLYDKTVKFLYKDDYCDSYKSKAGEFIENYNKRLTRLHPSYISNNNPTFTVKSFCITFIIVLSLLILFFIILFS